MCLRRCQRSGRAESVAFALGGRPCVSGQCVESLEHLELALARDLGAAHADGEAAVEASTLAQPSHSKAVQVGI
jgi:hypothetical protein